MPYAATRARKQLDAEFQEIIRRLRIAKRKKTATEMREYAVAAAVFLAHAEIENYVSDVFDALADLISTMAPRGSQLPKALRSHLFLVRGNIQVHIGARLAGGGERELLQSIENGLSGSAGTVVNDALALAPISGKEIYTDFKYPSIKNLERLLTRIGVSNPRGQLNGIIGRNVVALLESLASLRTSLAHNAALPGIAVPDIVSRISDAAVFVRALDRLLYREARRLCSDADWRAKMV